MSDILSPAAAMHAWAIATAAVVAAATALVGGLLVVRRMSLLGDAISHAVLPGIVVAVLAGGRPGGIAVLIGGVAAAVVTVWLTQLVAVRAGVGEDAGAGVVFTTLFAAGVLIISAAASRIDLDPACVLYGILELVPFDTIDIMGAAVPRAFLTGAIVLAAVAIGIATTWNLQVFTAFDAEAARAAGAPVAAVTAGLLTATALATVAGFEAVGAVLVVTMLVVPAATAELLVHRLAHVVWLAMVIAVTAAIVGYLAAWHWNTNAAGMMAVVLGMGYFIAALAAPGDGILPRLAARGWLRWRVACEDELAAIWRRDEALARDAPPPGIPRGGVAAAARAWLAMAGSLERGSDGWALSARGRREAELIVRSHRLWEAWLGRHADLPLDHLHPPAEWMEHHIGAEVRGQIERDLGWQVSDPHGSDIPPER